MIPEHISQFFWDVRKDSIDLVRNKIYVLSRLMELGDEEAVQWMEQRYSREDFAEILNRKRGLSAKSRNYWKLKYHVA